MRGGARTQVFDHVVEGLQPTEEVHLEERLEIKDQNKGIPKHGMSGLLEVHCPVENNHKDQTINYKPLCPVIAARVRVAVVAQPTRRGTRRAIAGKRSEIRLQTTKIFKVQTTKIKDQEPCGSNLRVYVRSGVGRSSAAATGANRINSIE